MTMASKLLPLLLLPLPSTPCCLPSYTFRLALSQDCSTNSLLDNNGIVDSLCFIESIESSSSDRSSRSIHHAGRSNATVNTLDDSEEIRQRSLSDSTPMEITSIQYLEFDTSSNLNVIYTYDDYLDVTLKHGEVFTTIASSSSTNGAGVEVGGASLILYGVTSSGVTIRNRFLWMWEDACEGVLEEGDGFGWVVVEDVIEPSPENCPSLPKNTPSPSPVDTPSPMGDVDWITPFPTPTGDEATDDDATTADDNVTDDNVTAADDNVTGDDATAGATDDVTTSNDDEESDDISFADDRTDDKYGPTSGTKTNKPYHSKASKNDVASGKTHKHPYDNWSYDDGQHDSVSGKSSKASGKSSKAFGKSSKGSEYKDDSYDAEEDYKRASTYNGENVR